MAAPAFVGRPSGPQPRRPEFGDIRPPPKSSFYNQLPEDEEGRRQAEAYKQRRLEAALKAPLRPIVRVAQPGQHTRTSKQPRPALPISQQRAGRQALEAKALPSLAQSQSAPALGSGTDSNEPRPSPAEFSRSISTQGQSSSRAGSLPASKSREEDSALFTCKTAKRAYKHHDHKLLLCHKKSTRHDAKAKRHQELAQKRLERISEVDDQIWEVKMKIRMAEGDAVALPPASPPAELPILRTHSVPGQRRREPGRGPVTRSIAGSRPPFTRQVPAAEEEQAIEWQPLPGFNPLLAPSGQPCREPGQRPITPACSSGASSRPPFTRQVSAAEEEQAIEWQSLPGFTPLPQGPLTPSSTASSRPPFTRQVPAAEEELAIEGQSSPGFTPPPLPPVQRRREPGRGPLTPTCNNIASSRPLFTRHVPAAEEELARGWQSWPETAEEEEEGTEDGGDEEVVPRYHESLEHEALLKLAFGSVNGDLPTGSDVSAVAGAAGDAHGSCVLDVFEVDALQKLSAASANGTVPRLLASEASALEALAVAAAEGRVPGAVHADALSALEKLAAVSAEGHVPDAFGAVAVNALQKLAAASAEGSVPDALRIQMAVEFCRPHSADAFEEPAAADAIEEPAGVSALGAFERAVGASASASLGGDTTEDSVWEEEADLAESSFGASSLGDGEPDPLAPDPLAPEAERGRRVSVTSFTSFAGSRHAPDPLDNVELSSSSPASSSSPLAALGAFSPMHAASSNASGSSVLATSHKILAQRAVIREALIQAAGNAPAAFQALDVSGLGVINEQEFAQGVSLLGVDWRRVLASDVFDLPGARRRGSTTTEPGRDPGPTSADLFKLFDEGRCQAIGFDDVFPEEAEPDLVGAPVLAYSLAFAQKGRKKTSIHDMLRVPGLGVGKVRQPVRLPAAALDLDGLLSRGSVQRYGMSPVGTDSTPMTRTSVATRSRGMSSIRGSQSVSRWSTPHGRMSFWSPCRMSKKKRYMTHLKECLEQLDFEPEVPFVHLTAAADD